MIENKFIQAPRIRIHMLETNTHPKGAEALLFIHGNGSSSVFWKGIISAFSNNYRVIAPDLRGYGQTEDLVIDATRGFADQAEDIIGLLDTLKIAKIHLVGHSMGGGAIYELIARVPERVISATLVNPVSPYGFGGTKGEEGIPVHHDYTGTGGGVANPEFARRIKEQDRTEDDPNASPRCVMNSFYFKPPFRAENEEELLDGILQQKIGDKRYPGDSVKSENWPFMAPGKFGPVNAASPKYVAGLAERFIQASPKPDILWIRGSHDQIVADESLFDMATLGKMGLIPGYPGVELYPPQPMVGQTRQVLRSYKNEGGHFREEVIENTGHTPFLENPETFIKQLSEFLNDNS